MNLREVQLSSRSLIPVALALPINRGPVDLRVQEERERRRADDKQDDLVSPNAAMVDRSIYFYI